MSAKITIIFFILICFEIGLLLLVIPWLGSHWDENYLLLLTADKLGWPWLIPALTSGYVKGAVSGVGLLNILLGLYEIVNFKKTARRIEAEWESDEVAPGSLQAAALSDNRPPDAPRQ